MAKAEPNVAAVNRLIRNESPTDTVDTVDVEHALAVLRSENARLKDCARVNAEREAQNEAIREKNRAHRTREILQLQNELLASQERVIELQGELLALRRIVNERVGAP